MKDTNIEHFYQNIKGWTSEKHFIMFDQVINQMPQNCVWVEVGVWQGQSVSYCAVELINKQKFGEFYAVDSFDGGIELKDHKVVRKNQLKEKFLNNLGPLAEKIKTIQSLSWDGAEHFEDNSIDFCYIDAGHTYDCVSKDIAAWYPKIKKNSLIGGDDYDKEVKVAVDEFIQKENLILEVIGRCWLTRKK